jgi:tetratricopeptide (TPR) repeat protein
LAKTRVTRQLTSGECTAYSVESEECRRVLAADSLVAIGSDQAQDLKVEMAATTFRKAKALNPALKLDPDTEAKRLAVESLAAKGEDLVRAGQIDGAIATVKEARELDPSFPGNRTAASVLLQEGENLAKSGDVNGAIAAFRQAQELDPSLNINPEEEANRPSVDRQLASAKQLVRQDKVNVRDAVSAYSEAITAYGKVEGLDPNGSIRAEAWNDLCWEASLRGHAAEVIDICERAVKGAAQLQPGSWNSRDSRGVARALTNDTNGAIEDFQFYVDHTTDKEKKLQRQQWIDALRDGKRPDEVLKSVLIQ